MRERERERECVCVCACVYVCMCERVCMYLCVCVCELYLIIINRYNRVCACGRAHVYTCACCTSGTIPTLNSAKDARPSRHGACTSVLGSCGGSKNPASRHIATHRTVAPSQRSRQNFAPSQRSRQNFGSCSVYSRHARYFWSPICSQAIYIDL